MPSLIMIVYILILNAYINVLHISQYDTSNPGLVTDIDNNSYKTFSVNGVTWMAENLRTTRYRDGSEITKVEENVRWRNFRLGAWSYYDNDEIHASIHGKLYNLYAVTDPRGLCPDGWEIPSKRDWDALVKVTSNRKKSVLSIIGKWDKNALKTNDALSTKTSSQGLTESMFNGYPSGYRKVTGEFKGMGVVGLWWGPIRLFKDYQSAYRDYNPYSLNSLYETWIFDIQFYDQNNTAYTLMTAPFIGLSVRCVKHN